MTTTKKTPKVPVTSKISKTVKIDYCQSNKNKKLIRRMDEMQGSDEMYKATLLLVFYLKEENIELILYL